MYASTADTTSADVDTLSRHLHDQRATQKLAIIELKCWKETCKQANFLHAKQV